MISGSLGLIIHGDLAEPNTTSSQDRRPFIRIAGSAWIDLNVAFGSAEHAVLTGLIHGYTNTQSIMAANGVAADSDVDRYSSCFDCDGHVPVP